MVNAVSVFDEPPKQERNAAEVVKCRVGACVLENDKRAVSERKHRGDWSATLPGYPDLRFVTHTFNQVCKPTSRLWEQMMAPSCH
jgi:hypothetical protein